MHDPPNAQTILGLVADFLREPQPGAGAFHRRVAANAIDLARREFLAAPEMEAAERRRLEALLNVSGDLKAHNDELCRRIRAGEIGLDDADLLSHVKATTLEKLSIDQPNFSSYLRARDLWHASSTLPHSTAPDHQ